MRNIIGVVLIIAMFGYTLFAIFQMPETIPIHFTKGEADGWGSKWISLLFPGIALAYYVGMSFYMKHLKKRHQSIVLTSWVNLGVTVVLAISNVFFIQLVLD